MRTYSDQLSGNKTLTHFMLFVSKFGGFLGTFSGTGPKMTTKTGALLC